MTKLLVGVLITVLGGLGVLWQVDQAVSRPAAAAPPLLCPLGGHGAYAAPPDWRDVSPARRS